MASASPTRLSAPPGGRHVGREGEALGEVVSASPTRASAPPGGRQVGLRGSRVAGCRAVGLAAKAEAPGGGGVGFADSSICPGGGRQVRARSSAHPEVVVSASPTRASGPPGGRQVGLRGGGFRGVEPCDWWLRPRHPGGGGVGFADSSIRPARRSSGRARTRGTWPGWWSSGGASGVCGRGSAGAAAGSGQASAGSSSTRRRMTTTEESSGPRRRPSASA